MTEPPKPRLFIAPKWAALALIVLFGIGGLWWMEEPTPVLVTVVQTAHAVPAYIQLTAADLVTETSPLTYSHVLTTVSAAIGQITKVALPAETIVTIDKVWKPALPVADWWIITVPLSATIPPAVGETVLVVGVDANVADAAVVSHQALVLGIENNRVVVALPSDEANQAVTYLIGNRRLLVVRRLP